MQTALLYFRGSGLSGWWIRTWTKSKYAHVAPATLTEDGTAWAFDAYWMTGVTRRLMTQADILAEAADIQRLPFDEAKSRVKQAWLLAQVGKKYDKRGIFVIGLTKRIPGWLHVYDSSQGEWLCSRLAIVCADAEAEAWGLPGPASPEDCHRIVKAKYGL